MLSFSNPAACMNYGFVSTMISNQNNNAVIRRPSSAVSPMQNTSVMQMCGGAMCWIIFDWSVVVMTWRMHFQWAFKRVARVNVDHSAIRNWLINYIFSVSIFCCRPFRFLHFRAVRYRQPSKQNPFTFSKIIVLIHSLHLFLASFDVQYMLRICTAIWTTLEPDESY